MLVDFSAMRKKCPQNPLRWDIKKSLALVRVFKKTVLKPSGFGLKTGFFEP